jgi:hypothetical protein
VINGTEDFAGQFMLLQQMPEIHDGSAVWNGFIQ